MTQNSQAANLPNVLPANPSTSAPEEEERMHEFAISDEQYAALVRYADQRGETPQEVFDSWVDMQLTFAKLGIGRIQREQQVQMIHGE